VSGINSSKQNGDLDEAAAAACEQVIAEYLDAESTGQSPDRQALLAAHPEIASELEDFLRQHDELSQLSFWWRGAVGESSTPGEHDSTMAWDHQGSNAATPQLPGYDVLHDIARGGMGVVYKARQTSLNRVVAVKMILHGPMASEAERRRFTHEAAAAAKLKHPHIVVIHEVGEHAGQSFFSMEYVEGESLSNVIRRGQPSAKTAARWVQQAAQAVQFAHDHGVLHRDIKPSNVLVDASGAARVTDFGLAKYLAADELEEKLTLTGDILGTPAYMAPEQITGPHSDIGPGCDVYALGGLLYELITGRAPFRGANNVETLMRALEEEPILPRRLNPAVPRELETIAMKCLEKRPENRYASAQAVADDLGRYLEGDSISASSPNLIDRVVRTLERSQYDREFHAWSRILFWIAGIALITHLVVFVNHSFDLPYPLTMQVAARVFEVLAMIAVFWALRRDWYPPRGAPARQLWAVWLGYMIGSQALLAVTWLLTPYGQFNELAVYPPMAVLASMAFIVLGSSYWGYCYVIGGVFLALALSIPAWLTAAPLVYGLAWAASLTTLAVRLSRFHAKG
jgi:serine/threonine protein kinase